MSVFAMWFLLCCNHSSCLGEVEATGGRRTQAVLKRKLAGGCISHTHTHTHSAKHTVQKAEQLLEALRFNHSWEWLTLERLGWCPPLSQHY